jgi:hypothetical protein
MNGLSPKQQDHLLAKCRKWLQESEKMVFHQSNKITYNLSAEQGHKSMRKWSFIKATGSLTS